MKPPLPIGFESVGPPAFTAPSGPVDRYITPLSKPLSGGQTAVPQR